MYSNSRPDRGHNRSYYENEMKMSRRTNREQSRPIMMRQAKESLEEQLEGFKRNVSQTADFISTNVERTLDMQVFPDLTPGALRKKLKDSAPEDPEDIKDILNDFAEHILPMTLFWKHPHFYAYFPGGNSFPNIIGDMLSTTFGGVGFSWTAQPSLTELERIMMDWVCHALDLPDFFSFEMSNGVGGGCIQNSASDAIFSSIIAARHDALVKHGCYVLDKHGNQVINEQKHPGTILKKLVAYVNQEAHSCVQKGSRIALCTMRVLLPNHNDEITGKIVGEAIRDDVKKGLVPFYCCASLGTTGSGAFDVLSTIGPVCKKFNVWLHIDGAYGGNAFICPEFGFLKRGIEYCHSMDLNPYKFLLGSIDCSCMYVRDIKRYKRAWEINATYLYDEFADEHDEKVKRNEIDYRHYGLPLSRRMRALKIYCAFRHYGIKGLQRYVRNAVKCAKHFESLVLADDRFEVVNDVWLALVCFRQIPQTQSLARDAHGGPMSHTDKQNLNLLIRINKSRFLHMVPGTLQGNYCLRFSVNYEHITIDQMNRAWNIIQSLFVSTLDAGIDGNMRSLKSADEIRETYRMGYVKLVSPEAYEKYVARREMTIPMTFGQIIWPIDEPLRRFLKQNRPMNLRSRSRENRELPLVLVVDRNSRNSRPNSRQESRPGSRRQQNIPVAEFEDNYSSEHDYNVKRNRPRSRSKTPTCEDTRQAPAAALPVDSRNSRSSRPNSRSESRPGSRKQQNVQPPVEYDDYNSNEDNYDNVKRHRSRSRSKTPTREETRQYRRKDYY